MSIKCISQYLYNSDHRVHFTFKIYNKLIPYGDYHRDCIEYFCINNVIKTSIISKQDLECNVDVAVYHFSVLMRIDHTVLPKITGNFNQLDNRAFIFQKQIQMIR